jgi:hypothetical protein
MDDGFLISAQTGRTIAELKRRVIGPSRPIPGRRGRNPQPQIEFEGQMAATLAAPSNGWTGATSANFQPYCVDPTSVTTPPVMISDPNLAAFSVVNRDPSLSVASGTYCRVKLINGEWKISWAGC